ncbi:hypothetical protein, partial [Stenotrophomonas maltophilia]
AWLAVDVLDTPKSLAKRVQTLEHRLVPYTLDMMIKKVIDIDTIRVGRMNGMIPLPLKFWMDDE